MKGVVANKSVVRTVNHTITLKGEDCQEWCSLYVLCLCACQFVVSAGVSTALTLPVLLVCSRLGVVQ